MDTVASIFQCPSISVESTVPNTPSQYGILSNAAPEPSQRLGVVIVGKKRPRERVILFWFIR